MIITNTIITDAVSRQLVSIEEGLDFVLSHFPMQEPIWPRKISTKATEGRQVLVYSREETIAWFKAANHLDCRISAYPDYTEWNEINRQAPNLIFVDEDQSSFKSREPLERAHKKTLKTIKDKLEGAQPTVIWSGNGYHILQPIKALVLESESAFVSFTNPSMKFLRFAERYLSNNKADQCHRNSLSFKNCMLRIPGSYNSKCVLRNNGIADSSTEVKIVQRWDGRRPAINYLLCDFRRYLIQEKIDIAFKDSKLKRKKESRSYYPTNHTNNHLIKWPWIETLLETPIADFRKSVMWRVLAPYLINSKKLSYDEAFGQMRDWLSECDKIRPLDFNIERRIRDNLVAAIKIGYFPISLSDLEQLNRELYNIIIIHISDFYGLSRSQNENTNLDNRGLDRKW